MWQVRLYDSGQSEAGHRPARTIGGISKRLFDIVSALFLVVLLAPLMLMTAVMIGVFDGRPLLIRHKRIGRNGVEFPCLKFRTMVVDSDAVLAEYLKKNPAAAAQWKANRKLVEDPRITRIGKGLRASSLDELPQLVNVLKGEMSLVGPRPIVRDEAANYGASFQDYVRARPGLTGLWQINGRSNTSYEERVRLDSDYVRSWSFRRDVAIILMTVPAVIMARGSL